MFTEHQIVKTRNFLYHEGSMLPKQSRGTIIHISTPGVYVVEFPTYGMNSKGNIDMNVEGRPTVMTVKEADLEECNEPL